MKKFYFTFGYGQNPGIGYYTIVEANSEAEARFVMSRLYPSKSASGGVWSFCYKSPEEAGIEEWNLKYVKPGFKFEEVTE